MYKTYMEKYDLFTARTSINSAVSKGKKGARITSVFPTTTTFFECWCGEFERHISHSMHYLFSFFSSQKSECSSTEKKKTSVGQKVVAFSASGKFFHWIITSSPQKRKSMKTWWSRLHIMNNNRAANINHGEKKRGAELDGKAPLQLLLEILSYV